jgi:hypothetical protein
MLLFGSDAYRQLYAADLLYRRRGVVAPLNKNRSLP